jgi:hypothetical protein
MRRSGCRSGAGADPAHPGVDRLSLAGQDQLLTGAVETDALAETGVIWRLRAGCALRPG